MNDIVNGLFEFTGALFILHNCRCLYRDKQLQGVSILTTVWFSAWGFFNLQYYPSLEQWYSFAGGCCIVLANLLWVGMAIFYKRNQ